MELGGCVPAPPLQTMVTWLQVNLVSERETKRPQDCQGEIRSPPCRVNTIDAHNSNMKMFSLGALLEVRNE